MNPFERESSSIGQQGLPGKDRRTAGIGYVVIPNDQGREEFIINCYNTKTLMLKDEYGGVYRRVSCDKDRIKDVVFPQDSSKFGSIVLWVRVDYHNALVAVAILEFKNKLTDSIEENAFRLQRISNIGAVDFYGKANEPEIVLNVISKSAGKGRYSINVVNPDDTATMDVVVRGKANLTTTDSVNINTKNEFLVVVEDKKANKTNLISYKLDTGLQVKDQYGNEILTKSSGVVVKVPTNKKTYLSGESNTQPVPLGNDLNNNIKDFIGIVKDLNTLLQQIGGTDATIATSFGLTYASQLTAQIPALTLRLTTLEQSLINHLSKRTETE